MLREIAIAAKQDGELTRRWYEDERTDLFVWFDSEDRIVRFQLAYDKPHSEKAIDWREGGGFTHSRVDDGATLSQHPGSPMLVSGGAFAKDRVIGDFRRRAIDIDMKVSMFVHEKLDGYVDEAARRTQREIAIALGALIGAAVLAWVLWR